MLLSAPTARMVTDTPFHSSFHTHTHTKQDLKEEYRLYRKQALAALREKDAALALAAAPGSSASAVAVAGAAAASSPSPGAARRGGSGGGAGLNLGDPAVQYLRNLCEKFFSTESPEVSAGFG